MNQQKDLAIVLRSVAYEERHKIVTAITENHGLVSAMARNAIQSRRFGGTLDLFTASEWAFSEKPGAELLNLQEATIKKSFDRISADFEKLSVASTFSELMLRLAPHRQSATELFKLHSNALMALDEIQPEKHLKLLNGYLAKLLHWSGNQPQVASCAGCAKPIEGIREEISCQSDRAVWLCAECDLGGSSSIRMSPVAILDFLVSLSLPIRQIASSTHGSVKDDRDLFRFLEAVFIFHVPGFDKQPLKSLRFLDLQSSVRYQAANPR